MVCRCIFCKKHSGDSVREEHIVPSALGNTEHVLPPGVVCDQCNEYFGRKIEKPLLDGPFFRNLRFDLTIPNREGNVPPITIFAMPHQLAPEGIALEIRREPDGSQSIMAARESQNDQFVNLLMSAKKFTAIAPVNPAPDQRLFARLLGKMALEAFARRALPIPGGIAEITNKPELDELRSFVRYDRDPKPWPFHQRHVYPSRFVFASNRAGDFEVLHEYMLLMTEAFELYFVFALDGMEYAINMGGREIDGYLHWLSRHDGRSPLASAISSDRGASPAS